MINLKNRSAQKELLDADNIPFADIKKNMEELDSINQLLGGHRITLKGLKSFLPSKSLLLSVCEIGCGGGDNLRVIEHFCANRDLKVQLTGIDLKKECIDYALERNRNLDAHWICSDYKSVDFNEKLPDIIFSSLFCHHFSNAELVQMIQWMNRNSRQGFFINDLQRNPLAYYSIKWLTKLFSASYLVKNDAPVSVARGFIKKDWQQLLVQAGITNYSLRWQWAFRYLIVCKHD
jgi:SAM-dependent methyltransferase